MNSPTPPDLSRLRPGVRFTAELTYERNSCLGRKLLIHATDGSIVQWPSVTAIHEPPVAPIAVGDRVHVKYAPEMVCTVIASDVDDCWGRWEDEDNGGFVAPRYNLTRIAPADRSGS